MRHTRRLRSPDDHALAIADICVRETGAVESALRLSHALSHYWFLRGYMSEGRTALDLVLALPGVVQRPDLLSRVLDRAGVLAAYQSDCDRGLQLIERCLAIRRDLGDREGVAETLSNLSYVLSSKAFASGKSSAISRAWPGRSTSWAASTSASETTTAGGTASCVVSLSPSSSSS